MTNLVKATADNVYSIAMYEDVAIQKYADIFCSENGGLLRALNPNIKTREDFVALSYVGLADGLNPVQSLRAYDIVMGRLTMYANIKLAIEQLKGLEFKITEDFVRMSRYYDKAGTMWDESVSKEPPMFFERDSSGKPVIAKQEKVYSLDDLGFPIPLDKNGVELPIHPARYVGLNDAGQIVPGQTQYYYMLPDGNFYKTVKDGAWVVSPETTYKLEPYYALIPYNKSGMSKDFDLRYSVAIKTPQGVWQEFSMKLSEISRRVPSKSGSFDGAWYTNAREMLRKEIAMYALESVYPSSRLSVAGDTTEKLSQELQNFDEYHIVEDVVAHEL